MSPEEAKIIWERGQKALERILTHVKVEKVEALAKKIEDPDFRNSFAFKQFLKSL